MNGLKKHLSVANVLSVSALFIALGGSAYAAVKLKPSQVKTVNIAKEAVTQPKTQGATPSPPAKSTTARSTTATSPTAP